MKPIFIRKYTPETERYADDFFNAYQEEGGSLEKAFAEKEQLATLGITVQR